MTAAPPGLRRLPAPGRFAEILARCAQAPEVPYRGISSYRLRDAGVLFARDEQIERLTQLITVYRGALVFGESGVGKTSMLNAGFVPEALALGYLPERVRLRRDPAAPIVIEHVGLETSASGLTLPSNFAVEGSGPEPSAMSTAERLGAGRSLALGIEEFRALLAALGPEHGALLVFDQFEELVTLFEDAPSTEELPGSLALQQRIFDLLVEALTSTTLAAKFVFSMREDYLGRLAPFLSRVPDLRERFVHVDALRGSDLQRIVRGPIERFADSYAGRMPEATLTEIVRRFQARVGVGAVNLSEVQIVCRRLWDEPAERARLEQEGIGAVIDGYFSEQFARSSTEEKAAIKAVMSCLVTSGGTRNWVSADDLLTRVEEETGAPRAGLEHLVRELDREGRRLVTSEERQNVTYYTILSEFLVPRIRTWQEERRFAEERARHEAAARQARQRFRLMLLLALLALAVYIGWEQYRRARESDRVAAAKADSLAVLLAHSDSLNARAALASERAESIAAALAITSDSLTRTASRGTAREQALAEQLQRTQAELRRVLALSDSARQSSASGSESLARENQLLREQLARTTGIARELRGLQGEIERANPKAASLLGGIAGRLDRLSPRAPSKAAY
ncbi:MAG TPA: hypothetical protein VFZ26_16100 [Gemmatimonadales bacterium]